MKRGSIAVVLVFLVSVITVLGQVRQSVERVDCPTLEASSQMVLRLYSTDESVDSMSYTQSLAERLKNTPNPNYRPRMLKIVPFYAQIQRRKQDGCVVWVMKEGTSLWSDVEFWNKTRGSILMGRLRPVALDLTIPELDQLGK